MKIVSDIIEGYTGHSRRVLEYSQTIVRMMVAAKQPGFSTASWGPLAELVDIESFERVGNFKEVMTWQEYINFLTGWAASSEWDCSFKRITEVGDIVFLELEEHSETDGYKSVVNSMSVYEFNNTGKIHHIDVYLQMELPPAEMLQNYEGVL